MKTYPIRAIILYNFKYEYTAVQNKLEGAFKIGIRPQ